MLIINDLHLGVNRAGGTTPQSQQALRDHLREFIAELIATETDHLVVNGDLFDGFTVDTVEVVKAYALFAAWLEAGGKDLTLVAGNHDWNPRGDKLSSFHLLCHFLKAHYPSKVWVCDTGFKCITGDVFCIPHMPNQELFNLEIEKALTGDAKDKHLLLHCNYKNGFAENSDHSLNINDDQVGQLMKAGWTLVIAHEHIGYTLRGGRVIVVGNQFPSSVADCIGDEAKHALRIMKGGHDLVPVWGAEGNYAEIDWHFLSDAPDVRFIRVTGDAIAAEAAEVVKAISALRQKHTAFVITNAVKVEGHDMALNLAEESMESIKSFDVLQAILAELNEEEAAVVKGLLQ